MTMRFDLDPGESLRIGEAVVRYEHKSGRRARVVVDAGTLIPVILLPAIDAISSTQKECITLDIDEPSDVG